VHSSDVFVSPTLRRASKRREEVSTQLLWLSDAPLCEGHGEADQTLHHRGTARRDSDCGLHAEFGGKGRSELLCDNLVLRPAGSAPSPLGWYISIVKSSGATCASLTSRRKCDDSARSTSLESLVTDVPFGRSIRTGGHLSLRSRWRDKSRSTRQHIREELHALCAHHPVWLAIDNRAYAVTQEVHRPVHVRVAQRDENNQWRMGRVHGRSSAYVGQVPSSAQEQAELKAIVDSTRADIVVANP
jgi:hypothetical protein